jgi:hypothetical protein
VIGHILNRKETNVAGRQVALHFAWSRPDEVAAPLGILEDRFPALFELRRMFWPRFEQFADPVKFDQGVGGFLDNIQVANFRLFADLAASWTGNPVRSAERRTDAGLCKLDAESIGETGTGIPPPWRSRHPGEAVLRRFRYFASGWVRSAGQKPFWPASRKTVGWFASAARNRRRV